MATKKKAAEDIELQTAPAAELVAEAGAQEMVAGAEALGIARGLARDAAGQLAVGASDLTRAEDAMLVAERVADLSGVVAAAGVVDMAQGAELLATSEGAAVLSSVVGLMGEEDLEHGMKLARLAGELQAVGKVVDLMLMPVLAKFLATRSEDLQGIAVDTIVRFGSNRALSKMIAAKGLRLEEMGVEEVSEGLARVAASQAMVERSEEFAAASVVLAVKGAVEVETALEEADLADKVGRAGVAGIAEGAALLGAAESSGMTE